MAVCAYVRLVTNQLTPDVVSVASAAAVINADTGVLRLIFVAASFVTVLAEDIPESDMKKLISCARKVDANSRPQDYETCGFQFSKRRIINRDDDCINRNLSMDASIGSATTRAPYGADSSPSASGNLQRTPQSGQATRVRRNMR
ncbi:hypothetical protein CTI12_AA077500 [Artemisia annua]|uniref:Uncharacterized protein n=1 Tax=Artemisia annua TaxID=35608 RepID=A0A2U1Q4A8_ARTAN|nr:hypothetical protein CTI12_AA077500 [Artemisia annua]